MKKNKRTLRGFPIYAKFKDSYGADVRIQLSSNVLKRCWIFVESDKPDYKTDGAIHLTETQAKKVIVALQRFLKDY